MRDLTHLTETRAHAGRGSFAQKPQNLLADCLGMSAKSRHWAQRGRSELKIAAGAIVSTVPSGVATSTLRMCGCREISATSFSRSHATGRLKLLHCFVAGPFRKPPLNDLEVAREN